MNDSGTHALSPLEGAAWPQEFLAIEAGGLAARAKRLVDVCLALALILLLAPVFLLLAVAIRITSRGQALFVQKRIGHRASVFNMYKFRTMRDDSERLEGLLAEGLAGRTFFKVEHDPRVTPLGRWLRRFSLDELPQLFNVLRGDMSLVGPRPLLVRDYELFPKRDQLRRFAFKPGLTGLWQVSGRSLLSDDRRMELDLAYVDGWSLGLDLEIIARTLPVVASGKGAY